MKIYLAGPLGFSEAGKGFHRDAVARPLAELGHELLDPWDLAPTAKIKQVMALPYSEQRRDAWRTVNFEIGDTNRAAIDQCDLVCAVLDGTDVDSGTASEIGYAFALGKPIVGYRGDFRLSADNEGSIVNLQVEYFVRASGGEIVQTITELPGAVARAGALLLSPKAATQPPRVIPPTAVPVPVLTTAQQETQQTAWRLIISILLALIVRAALEAIFKTPVQEDKDWPTPLVWGQLLTFSVMVARFYLGSTRYIDSKSESIPFPLQVVNVVFASALFAAFYVAGLAVAEVQFYFALVALHAVDALWFIFAICAMPMTYDDRPGELRTAAVLRVMGIFLGLSVTTIVLALVLYFLAIMNEIEHSTAMWSFLAGLWILSIYDFTLLFDYYFRHAEWLGQNRAPQ